MNDDAGLCRRQEKWLRPRRLSSSETTVFVVAEHDNDNNTATTTVFGGASATLRTDSELATMSDGQRQARDTTNYTTATTDDSRAPQPTDNQEQDPSK